MDFVTSRENLFQELQMIQGIVEKKSTIPILSNILIEARKDRLEFQATDMEVGIRTSCEAKVKEPGSLTVSARRLFEIVRYLPDEDVRIRSEENNWVVITCQKARFRIVGLGREDFPLIPEFDFRQGIPIERPLLLDMVNKVIFAVTTDDQRPQMSGALLVMEKKHLTLVATDGHRLACVKGKLKKGSSEHRIEILLPRKAVVELSRIGEGGDEVLFGQEGTQAFFKIGRTTLNTSLTVAKFPDYEKVLPQGNDRHLKLDSTMFADVVRRVALLSSDRSRAVKLSLGKGTLEITSSNPEVGEAAESLDVEYDGQAMDVGFNAKYLIDFLQAMGPGTVDLALKDEATQGLLSPIEPEGREYRYVVMPMRI